MIAIDREPIHPDSAIETVKLLEFFAAFVAVRTKTLQLCQPKFIDVTMMGLNVIGNSSGDRTTTLTQAPFAQGLHPKLMPSHPFPAF